MARLGIALISFANATAALGMPRTLATFREGALPAIETAGTAGSHVRVQRLPRVPRREPFVAGPSHAAAQGVDA